MENSAKILPNSAEIVREKVSIVRKFRELSSSLSWHTCILHIESKINTFLAVQRHFLV